MDSVEKLYRNYEVLADAKEKILEHEKEYFEILDAVKGSTNEKRLASQFITRFFKSFPHLVDKAIDAQLDLCEDDDVSIRKQAIKELPSFCKENIEFVPKIADVLAQLLLTDEPSELTVVHAALMTVFRISAKDTLGGLFSQIFNGEEVVRERAIRFLNSKTKALPSDIMTKELEDYILQECQKIMQDVTGEEFITLMSVLSGLKLSKTIPGQQTLVDMAVDMLDIDKEFEHTDSDSVVRVMQCIRQALPFFNPYVSSGRFVQYFCKQVVPVLESIPTIEEGTDVSLELLKLLADMAPCAINLENNQKCLEIVFNKLLEYVPPPPSNENVENSTPSHEPSLQLSHVECLLYTFHQLCKHDPEFLSSVENTERLRDFKLRLQYLAQGIQGYIKKLRAALQGKKEEELKTDENKLKVVALKTTSNINTLIRDLFHSPPSFKSTVTLSWKVPSITTTKNLESNTSGKKRPERTPINFDENPKQAKKAAPVNKGEREMYAPPSGKYSTKVKNFQTPLGGRGGRGRGISRGRGRGYRDKFY
ncbi:apoptosis inhibitor 5-like [Limulus polyphemus]|uniref:Apoptosis inhibitor 5-like n=1 Tax=Limulus polyphemus TaxID=6850 RepID=A0ABM1BB85_LIMPO|nr:apoptosis inhibitor 5-like [Limulus polyphemus]